MVIKRLFMLFAQLSAAALLSGCFWPYCHTTPSPGKVAVEMQDGFSTEFAIRPEKAKPYIALLVFEQSDLEGRLQDGELPERAIAIKVEILDERGAVQSAQQTIVERPFSRGEHDRDWNVGLIALTNEPQIVRITILRVDPSLSGLVGVFRFMGSYPKSCD